MSFLSSFIIRVRVCPMAARRHRSASSRVQTGSFARLHLKFNIFTVKKWHVVSGRHGELLSKVGLLVRVPLSSQAADVATPCCYWVPASRCWRRRRLFAADMFAKVEVTPLSVTFEMKVWALGI